MGRDPDQPSASGNSPVDNRSAQGSQISSGVIGGHISLPPVLLKLERQNQELQRGIDRLEASGGSDDRSTRLFGAQHFYGVDSQGVNQSRHPGQESRRQKG